MAKKYCDGFVHSAVCTAGNVSECKAAPKLLRKDDAVVYGDAGYLKMERYVGDGIEREYRINRQRGAFKRHYGGGLAWQFEKELEKRKSSMRCKVEYIFHVIKDIFKWRKARYKGIYKNAGYANLVLAGANLYCWQRRKRKVMHSKGVVRPNPGIPPPFEG